MTTRLTNDMRASIVESAMRGTTYEAQSKKIRAEAQAHARAFINASQPPEFLKLVKGKPVKWFQLQAELRLHDLRGSLPSLHALLCGRINLEDPVPFATYAVPNLEFVTTVKDLEARAGVLNTQQVEARRSLMSFLRSCSTAEKVLERMPELKPHVTVVAVSYPLVAPSNALSMLQKLGFDQTVK